MSLKMMKKTLLVSAIVAVGSLSVIACGDSKDDPEDEKDSGPVDTDGGTEEDAGPPVAAKRTRSGFLVAITAQDTAAPIKVPHKIVVLDSLTGKPLDPPLSAMTSSTDGSWMIKDIPTATPIALHIQGQGDATTGYYDSVITNITAKTSDDPLTRISSASTASIAGQVAGFTPDATKGAISGGVYLVKDGKRTGVIGCTQVWLDDDTAQPPSKGDLRYVGSNGLPAPIATADRTEATRGAFLFANIEKGKHKVKFSVDGGKNFFGETEFYIGMAREDATSAYKGILYQIGIEVDEDKTPAGCK